MAFESLSDKLSAAFKKLRGKGRLSEADVKEAMREVRLALLEADVSYKVVKDFVKKVSERAVGSDVLESLSPAQMVIKIVNEELIALMGSESVKLNIGSENPTVVMLALSFLLMIGMTLIADGFGVHVPKGYIYAAMAFSALVEGLNFFARRAQRKRIA